MHTTQGISLHIYISQTSKTPCFSFYLLWFFFHKIGEQEGRIGGREGGPEGGQRGRK
jgi:hypothetical protein